MLQCDPLQILSYRNIKNSDAEKSICLNNKATKVTFKQLPWRSACDVSLCSGTRTQPSPVDATRTRWRHLASGPRCPGPSGRPSLRCPAGPRWSRPPECSHCTWYESRWHVRICTPLHRWLRRLFTEIRASTGLSQEGSSSGTGCSDTMAHTHTHILLVFPKSTIKIPEQNKSREFYQMLWFQRTSNGLTFQAGSNMPLLEELPCWVFLSIACYRGHPQLVLEARLGQEEGPPLTTGYGAAYTTTPPPHPKSG